MERNQQTARSAIGALITAFLWASAFPAVKYLLDYYSAESIMLFRFLVASLTLLLIAVVKRVKIPARKDLPLFALGGLLGIFLYAWLFITGTDTVPSGVSSFLIASAPMFTTLLSIFILKEKVKLFSWLGMLVSLGGLILITASQMSGFVMNIGVILLVGASISTSAYIIIQRRLTEKYTPLEVTAFSVFFGTLFMLVFLPGLIREIPGVPLIVNLIPVYLGLFPAAIAYLFWAYAISKARSTAHVTMFLYLIPLLATLLAFLWLDERLSLSAFIGGIVIILGMFISGKWGRV